MDAEVTAMCFRAEVDVELESAKKSFIHFESPSRYTKTIFMKFKNKLVFQLNPLFLFLSGNFLNRVSKVLVSALLSVYSVDTLTLTWKHYMHYQRPTTF